MAATTDATWELVLKRNPVERLKQEKSPLGILDELPALIADGYERMAEEDIVRLKWWGLYHDKPKIGTFMLRIKLPGGLLTPAQLRAIGEISNRFGRGDGELTTRQNVQLHWIELAALPDVFALLDARRADDRRRVRRHRAQHHRLPRRRASPHDELFDATPIARGGRRVLLRQPGLLRPAAQAQDHDLGLPPTAATRPRSTASPSSASCTTDVRDSRCWSAAGSPRCRGSRATSASSSRKDEALEVLRALLDAWREDLAYRVSRVKARMKFMVDDYRPRRACAPRSSERLGRAARGPRARRRPTAVADHMGVHAQSRPGLFYVGVPVHLGLVSGEQMVAVADLAERLGGDVRVTRQQNFVARRRPRGAARRDVAELEAIGFPLDVNRCAAASIACTGEPHCNFSVDGDEDAARTR